MITSNPIGPPEPRATLTLALLMSAGLSPYAHADAGDRDQDEDGYTRQEGDCDDTRSDTWPGAEELCFDGQDQDCNGTEDDQCMYVGTEWIRLEPSAGEVTYYVDYPEEADETLAFLAVGKLIEHSDNQCDFETVITDEGSRYRFDVDLEHCGYGHYDSAYGFEAQAVVFARVGGVGGFTYFDVESKTESSGDTHRWYDSTTVPNTDAEEEIGVCAIYSSDGEGDVDTEWYCDATLEDGTLSAELYEDYGNSSTWVGARFMAIGLGDNLEITKTPFGCGTDRTMTYTHTVSDRLGDDHAAIVILDDWDTDEKDHLSMESDCNRSGDEYECTVTCYGSGDNTNGTILFIDGSFQ